VDLLAIVAFVEAQMLSAARAPGARQWKTVERLEEKFLIVGVGAANRQTNGHAAAVAEDRPLDS